MSRDKLIGKGEATGLHLGLGSSTALVTSSSKVVSYILKREHVLSDENKGWGFTEALTLCTGLRSLENLKINGPITKDVAHCIMDFHFALTEETLNLMQSSGDPSEN